MNCNFQANYSGNKTNYTPPKPIIKAKSHGNLTENGKKSLLMQHNDQHDQLIAEFRKVHRKLFSSANLEAAEAEQDEVVGVEQVEDTEEAQTNANKTEDIHGGRAGGSEAAGGIVVQVHGHHGNRSYDETLVKPTKSSFTLI